MSESQMFLPLPPQAPLLLSATLPPRTPASALLLRALATSSLGLAIRRFVVERTKDFLKDPRKIMEIFRAYFNPRSPSFSCRLVILAGRGQGGLKRLVEGFVRSATVQGIVILVASMMLMHVGRDRREEDEDQDDQDQGQDEDEDEQGVRSVIAPRPPPPELMWLPHQHRKFEFQEAMRIDRIFGHKDGLKKTEQTISRQISLKALKKTSKECEGSLKTEYTKFEATDDKFCEGKAAQVQNFKDLFSESVVDPKSLQRMKQLNHCLSALKHSVFHREKGRGSPELETKRIADTKESVKRMMQGNKSISMLRKSFTSFLGHDE